MAIRRDACVDPYQDESEVAIEDPYLLVELPILKEGPKENNDAERVRLPCAGICASAGAWVTWLLWDLLQRGSWLRRGGRRSRGV